MLRLSSGELCVFRTHGLASQISSDKLCVFVTWSSVPNYCSFFSDKLCVIGTQSELLQLSSDKFWGHGLASHIAAAFFRHALCFGDMV